jgi:adenylate cyclase
VNLAQRLQELNKEFETACLICGTTINAARSGCADAVAIGPLQVRGRAGSVEIYALPYISPDT